MKKAQLTTKYVGNDIEYKIKAGEKGKGETLWTCKSWDNPRATENAERMAFDFAKQKGLTLVQPEE